MEKGSRGKIEWIRDWQAKTFRYYTPGKHFDSGQCRSGIESLQCSTYTRCAYLIFESIRQYWSYSSRPRPPRYTSKSKTDNWTRFHTWQFGHGDRATLASLTYHTNRHYIYRQQTQSIVTTSIRSVFSYISSETHSTISASWFPRWLSGWPSMRVDFMQIRRLAWPLHVWSS